MADEKKTGDDTQIPIRSIRMVKETLIKASPAQTFAALLEEMGPGSEMPDGTLFPMVIEAWPGGRLFRDLGDKRGHFWGHVQVIKPPTLLELVGPMFMSFAATNHVQYRVTAEGASSRLTITHCALGQMSDDISQNMGMGWDYALKRVGQIAERSATARKG